MTIKEKWYFKIRQSKLNHEKTINEVVNNIFEDIKILSKGNSVTELRLAVLQEIKNDKNMPAIVADKLKRKCDDYINSLEIK